jgi:putative endonuclease
MKYVYLLQSVEYPDQTYVGLTEDLRSRLSAHNKGRSSHTDKYKPWRLVTYLAFSDERKADGLWPSVCEQATPLEI